MAMWQQDYDEALAKAESVIGLLVDPGLRGYRALWEYLAGSSAMSAASEGNSQFIAKAREHYGRAKYAAQGIPWLVRLSQVSTGDVTSDSDANADEDQALRMLQVEKIEAVLTSLGTTHDRSYSVREREILEGLEDESLFENSHKMLGEHLGFDAGKEESPASPDPWWQLGKICLVFEDHVNAGEGSSLDATKARQVASHPAWMRDNVASCQEHDVEILPVLVTSVTSLHPGASSHLGEVCLWRLDEFKSWAHDAMALIRELRKKFIESGDLVWRVQAAEAIESNGFGITDISLLLKSQIAKDLLVEQ